jgi:hypothetical protein
VHRGREAPASVERQRHMHGHLHKAETKMMILSQLLKRESQMQRDRTENSREWLYACIKKRTGFAGPAVMTSTRHTKLVHHFWAQENEKREVLP